MKEYFFIRHATPENDDVSFHLSGFDRDMLALEDHPLSKRGKEQASKISSYVINQNTDRIVSSTLKRAIETAAIISEKTGIEYNLQIPELNEFAPGSLPLKEKGIIRLLKSRRWPAFVRKYLNSILYSGLSIYYFNQWYRGRTKGGDTMESIDRRINSVLNRLDDLPERRIAIVGHGYWFIFLALKIYGYKKRNILRLRWINNCSVTRIATNGNGDYTLISFARRHI